MTGFALLTHSCFQIRAESQEKPIREKEISFSGANGIRLHGSLTLPAKTGKYPAFLFISGSGPTDRNGDSNLGLKTSLFKSLASTLAENGIASFRFDKRVTGETRKLIPRDPVQLSEFCSWENFIGDAEAAFLTLSKFPEIDSSKTGIFGHSEGGMLALEIASKSKALHPAALILAGTPGRTIDLLLHDQLSLIMSKQKASPEVIETYLKQNGEICAYIRKNGTTPSEVPAGLASLYPPYLGKFLHSELQFDPAKAAQKYQGPVLILQGECDQQVSPTLDAKALHDALKARKKDSCELFISPKSSHNLKVIRSETDLGFVGDIEPTTLSKVISWTTRTLKKG